MKKCYLLFCTLLFLSHGGFSQSGDLSVASAEPSQKSISPSPLLKVDPPERSPEITALTVSGQVKDENGQGFPGVNIIVKGTTAGTTTDVNGRYALQVEDENAILVFSFVGYNEQEITLGGRTVVDVTMTPNLQALEEVVVTALGIEKSQKSLGYATSKVTSEDLTINRTPNLMNALQGKIAGVSISALGTGPGGTSKIRIRGQSSMSGQNNPLIVVNGVPIDNTNFGTNQNNAAADNSIQVRGGGVYSDGGDGLSSINPDDVESMTILKGAAASALYGSRASNGVIMITTKTRGKGEGLGVTYNMNYTNETPLDFTDYQYEYGQGENGIRPTTPNPTSGQWSFGERFQPGMRHVLFNNLDLPYEPQRNRIRDFYRNGQNLTNTITLSTNGDKGGLSFSMANLNSKGIVPNNSLNRKIFNLGFNYALSDKFSFKGNLNYSNEVNTNPPNIANQDNSIPTSISNLSNSMPLNVLDENKYNALGNEYVYSRFMNRTNPYWVLAEQFNNIRRDRIFGNFSLKYDVLKWLYVQARAGQDYWSRDQEYNNFPTGHASRAAAPPGFVNGMYTQEARRFREINSDILIGASPEFGDIALNLTVGGNQMTRRSDVNSVQVTDFVVRDLYTVQNGRAKDPTYGMGEMAVNSLYGSAEISYKGFLFVNATHRRDWFSTLSAENRSFPYSSLSASFVFSESMDMPTWLSFGKVRLAYAGVGGDSDVGPYSDVLYYGVNANLANNPAGAPQPVGNISGNTVPNANLKNMDVDETEAGLELKLFNSRIGLDVSVYRKITTDQIVRATISDASGFIDTQINSGQSQNKGIEMMLNVVPVMNNDFRWDLTFNAAYNVTKVLSILTDTPGERITTGTHVFNGELRHIVGEEMAQITGYGYRRDAEGRKIFGANGIALRTLEPITFGSALPRWVGGINNAFAYKNLVFSFLIDFKLGNTMLSGTNFNLVRHGLHKMTLEGRVPAGETPGPGSIIGDGVYIDANGVSQTNTFASPVQAYWEVVRSQALIEPVVYNGGYWKLRQITLGYDFTKFLPERFPVKGLRLSFVANNVLMLKKWVDNIDPESFGYSSDNIVGMESTGVPTTRGMGFNLNVKL